ncbi:MAG: hydroxyethylthiazole kinase [Phreatobacter sp.]|uniref:hydroxyethylthiazole kinase n=1 Tax=Phreatobacter sp. TaxID=1966341 RepID=UPI001A5091F9|nr:hydroxyethylthiazole kinase [Phreatobacter sp.]MBL8572010.1 hydroxyethylthiazole kinase [Phreatobacter sp.]
MNALSGGGSPSFSPIVDAALATELLGRVRQRRPRVHCITNTVAQEITANAVLAVGATPSVTISRDEIAAFVASADALLVNLGTLEPAHREVIAIAIAAARDKAIPWVLDPVFIDRSPVRAAFAREIAAQGPALVRGNTGEIAVLGDGADAAIVARALRTVVAATGETDWISDGGRSVGVANGHPMMASVTGMGCAGAAVTAAFLAVGDDPLVATASALLALGVAGEMAAETARGPGTFAPAYLDALHHLGARDLSTRARIVDIAGEISP